MRSITTENAQGVKPDLDGQEKTLKPSFTQEGHPEHEVRGSQKITIRQRGEKKSKSTQGV